MSRNYLPLTGFDEMNLSLPVFSALQDVGYNTPTPIQSMAIPHMVNKKDILAQAKTGTGKTAAFALPLLSRIDLKIKHPQALILTPTRELAIQVGHFFKSYGARIKGLGVLSVYGGQSYTVQLNQLKCGVHIIVGTPGRLMDHMRKNTISLKALSCVVIDEADEMLHMGFIDDVEWILERVPDNSQTALFSATMPFPIRKIAQKYLTEPEEIIIEPDNKELDAIDQQYWMIKGINKTQALIRILSATSFDGVIVFVKTKSSTLEIAKQLEDHGFKAEALNGDLAQNARERTISRLKNAKIDILVATDVAARGLDVDRISHVINYDLPSKTEPYIHRIGRTGRAGRTGIAISFVGRKERWLLRSIEKKTKKKIKQISLPSNKDINAKKISDFKHKIDNALKSGDNDFFLELIESYAKEQEVSTGEIAAALARMIHGDTPFLLPVNQPAKQVKFKKSGKFMPKTGKAGTYDKIHDQNNFSGKTHAPLKPSLKSKEQVVPKGTKIKTGMERYRIEIGRHHGIKPGDIVGAISNEAGLDSKYIGSIDINRNCSFVDLPSGMPKEIFRLLKKTWVKSHKMAISKCA